MKIFLFLLCVSEARSALTRRDMLSIASGFKPMTSSQKAVIDKVCQNTSIEQLENFPQLKKICKKEKSKSNVIKTRADLDRKMKNFMRCSSILECSLYARLK